MSTLFQVLKISVYFSLLENPQFLFFYDIFNTFRLSGISQSEAARDTDHRGLQSTLGTMGAKAIVGVLLFARPSDLLSFTVPQF